MKKIFLLAIISIVAVLFLFIRCMNTQTKETKSKTLIVYYSRTGNTEALANHIQALTGADMFKIETVEAYPEDYPELTEIAQAEKNNQVRPAIKEEVDNIDQYDAIFIGFPIWWGTLPMVMATFLESYSLEGKTIIPFCTHGNGGVDQGFIEVQKLSSKANHKEGFSLKGIHVDSARLDVEKWLKAIQVID
ncbi:MAG: NAD(P)H-dependent oxidoreductase [Tannerellaceae bacterium]|jgi:flavodoxin|nr:NAD(P)H-dependent oxidoreductase [Tannerellaceae bacterium]